MVNVSFYLLTPKAKTQSMLYVSICKERKRIRFATGHSFLTKYCHIRQKKGNKELIRRNTEFYYEYTQILNSVRDKLVRIALEQNYENNEINLERIMESYLIKAGKLKDTSNLSFTEAYRKYIESGRYDWTENTMKKVTSTYNHLTSFFESIKLGDLQEINSEVWDLFRDQYCTETRKFSNNTSNTYLKNFKQFLKYCVKMRLWTRDIDLNDFGFLDEIEVYNIALRKDEVETLIALDLSMYRHLDKARDLFILEILTGQRFSDLPKVLDKRNLHPTYIDVYQEKTNERVKIPLHPELKNHLALILNKYGDHLPVMSNQKFNDYLKEIGKLAKIDREHSWTTLVGSRKIRKTEYRYNLITSHTGRRTFCTLSLQQNINHEVIMKITGHKSYDQFKIYVKIDAEESNLAFRNFSMKGNS